MLFFVAVCAGAIGGVLCITGFALHLIKTSSSREGVSLREMRFWTLSVGGVFLAISGATALILKFGVPAAIVQGWILLVGLLVVGERQAMADSAAANLLKGMIDLVAVLTIVAATIIAYTVAA